MAQTKNLESATILFAGDSGDGMQLTGSQFTDTSALFGNDLSTFPDFPAEIRAPKGTISGVSGFQIHFGSNHIFSPGDHCDVLVAMNAAAFVKSVKQLKPQGIVIANSAGFDKRNIKLAGCDSNPLEDEHYIKDLDIHSIDISKLTKEALVDSGLGTKDIDRSKNMFILGFIYWLYNRTLDYSIQFIEDKFKNNPAIRDANIKVLKAGYYYGDTARVFQNRFNVAPANLSAGTYRNISGNHATALALVSAASKAGLNLFYGGYPITPASDILHYLAKYRSHGVNTFQAEDEIAGISSAIGASFAGDLGTTASSGPGIALKGEALGLAFMLELPLVVINVQRGGPSTGLPTKTEQSDLFQALHGRNGDAPIPILAPKNPVDCFDITYQAAKIALEHMTPVFVLSDGFIANGSGPWKFPQSNDLPEIQLKKVDKKLQDGEIFYPYKRDEKGVRTWAIPGDQGYQHRVGGLEKEDKTGNISYSRENHQRMTDLRNDKFLKIADSFGDQEIETGPEKGKLVIVSWGSTYGSIKTALEEHPEYRELVAHIHLRHINPLPKNLKMLLNNYDRILVPELNNGQLANHLQGSLAIEVESHSKVAGSPFHYDEILEMIKQGL